MSLLNTLSSTRAAGAAAEPMFDVAFALSGQLLPYDYAFALEAALLERLPWLAEEPAAGVHPLRAPATAYGLVLSRRTRLVLRLPESRLDAAEALCGARLELGQGEVQVGGASGRRVEPFATLSAWNVASAAEDEAAFLADVAFQLEVMGVRAKLICGRPETVGEGDRRLSGFGLALHELSPSHSLLVQARGLGPARRLGCGVFVPHKIIEGLGDEPD